VEAENRALSGHAAPEKTVLVGHGPAGILPPEAAAANRSRVARAVYLRTSETRSVARCHTTI